MSKFTPLWKYISLNKQDDFQLTFDQIQEIAGIPIDHSFLTYKKELINYGFKVEKISLKHHLVKFQKI